MRNQILPGRVFLKLINFCFYRNNENERQSNKSDTQIQSIVLYDHACPLCRAEMQRLKALDRNAKLVLLDINSSEFNEDTWGVSRSAASAALHVFTPRDNWLIGMPAIRHVYAQVGLGWLMAPTGWPLVSPLADLAYRYFAPNRFVISRWLGMGQASESCSDNVCTNAHNQQGVERYD